MFVIIIFPKLAKEFIKMVIHHVFLCENRRIIEIISEISSGLDCES